MHTRQDIVRREYLVTIRREDGTTWSEWRLTSESAEALRERYNVVSIELTDHLLDY